MIFDSTKFEPGSLGSSIVTVVVIVCVVGSIALFFWMLAHEMRRSCRHSRRMRVVRLLSSRRPAVPAAADTINPMRAVTTATMDVRRSSARDAASYSRRAGGASASASAPILSPPRKVSVVPSGVGGATARPDAAWSGDPVAAPQLLSSSAATDVDVPAPGAICEPPLRAVAAAATAGEARPAWWLQVADDGGDIWYYNFAAGQWDASAPPRAVAVVTLVEAAAAAASDGWVWCTDPASDRAFAANTISGAAMWEAEAEAMYAPTD